MKLLLTSAGFKNPKIWEEFLKLIGKPAKEIKIIFIPTASRTPEELKYVKMSKQELYDLGIEYENITILNLNRRTMSESEMLDYDAIYVCGGNTFYLLSRLKETKFHQKIKQFVKKGKVYVGVSAGSIVAGPDIEIAGWGSEGDKNDCDLENFKALNLAKIAIFPHYYIELKKEVNEFAKKVNYPILALTDNQAFLINGKEEKIIE